jgi:hypothetical protein
MVSHTGIGGVVDVVEQAVFAVIVVVEQAVPVTRQWDHRGHLSILLDCRHLRPRGSALVFAPTNGYTGRMQPGETTAAAFVRK